MTKYDGDDIYCDLIIPRKIDFEVVKETRNILAYHHTNPFWETHIVVVPKHHVPSLLELNLGSQIAFELFTVAKQLATKMKDELGACRMVTNFGDYQDSKHLHIHISHGDQIRKPVG